MRCCIGIWGFEKVGTTDLRIRRINKIFGFPTLGFLSSFLASHPCTAASTWAFEKVAQLKIGSKDNGHLVLIFDLFL